MKPKLSGELMKLGAAQWHEFAIDLKRATEIARDLDKVNDAAQASARARDFNEEPAHFSRTLEELASVKKFRK